ncbi:hypothetical protein RJZ56_005400 [Blastomyces dermatitidis]|uniref:Uncharacterized protein n=1 Tax=Ajellomyces dermatitidis (strain ATCC 18188 / CBS 674.68) TaxID=653446 RepID=A0A0J9EW13_AJEDA|nr:hypothetical protein BDDG_13521 [Blastomyces dermatitidis ATCC 18188]
MARPSSDAWWQRLVSAFSDGPAGGDACKVRDVVSVLECRFDAGGLPVYEASDGCGVVLGDKDVPLV